MNARMLPVLLAMALSASSAWCSGAYPDREKVLLDARVLSGTPKEAYDGGPDVDVLDSTLEFEFAYYEKSRVRKFELKRDGLLAFKPTVYSTCSWTQPQEERPPQSPLRYCIATVGWECWRPVEKGEFAVSVLYSSDDGYIRPRMMVSTGGQFGDERLAITRIREDHRGNVVMTFHWEGGYMLSEGVTKLVEYSPSVEVVNPMLTYLDYLHRNASMPARLSLSLVRRSEDEDTLVFTAHVGSADMSLPMPCDSDGSTRAEIIETMCAFALNQADAVYREDAPEIEEALVPRLRKWALKPGTITYVYRDHKYVPLMPADDMLTWFNTRLAEVRRIEADVCARFKARAMH